MASRKRKTVRTLTSLTDHRTGVTIASGITFHGDQIILHSRGKNITISLKKGRKR